MGLISMADSNKHSILPHRILQILALFFILILIPIIQYSLNSYSQSAEEARNKQTDVKIDNIYYFTSRLNCNLLDERFKQNCDKGVYYDPQIKSASHSEVQANKSFGKLTVFFWCLYSFASLLMLFGTYKEYRFEYINYEKSIGEPNKPTDVINDQIDTVPLIIKEDLKNSRQD
jgi:hypothetical protein